MENEKINIIQNNIKISTHQLVFCAIFTALIALGAFIKVPIPVLPFTLQFLFTTMAGLILGGRIGAYSVLMYILLGLMGLPIFSEGGGIGYIFKPSFGYLIGFYIASYVTGKIVNRKLNPTFTEILSGNFIGLAIVYGIGMIYYYIICNYVINTPIGLWPLFLYCFILAVPGDILLCILCAHLYKRLTPAIKKLSYGGV
ncbi:biotin transporter BioY [Clostridium sp.]|uniref:biotin transporter BioY n=1 Tax=Clostridium sp. TaxID=1506 RepID=UPI00262E9331|nr:biotin transporter BioY [Clostridium sp.]